jgi:aminopeptidase N
MSRTPRHPLPVLAAVFCCALLASAILAFAPATCADEPYAPSRDYDLQDIRTHLWFDIDKREVRGEVTEQVAALRDGVTELRFDSVGLAIQSVAVDGKTAKFSTTPKDLLVSLDHPAARGQRLEVLIHYDGQPKKGMYFVLPDKNYPDQPKEIWTQGEAEDTRYYLPLYDYPNDRMTSEMLLTVPAKWITISNGRLAGVADEADGTKTWDWKQSDPMSSYLLTAVAGDFVERDDSWRGVPLRFVVPRGEESKIDSTFPHTKEMLELFANRLGVPYPWAQYAETSVDEFVTGGMENTSATTLGVRDLVNPKLAPELRIGDDTVTSHEMAHQWFGDLVTCKDWANLWLNEGFATFFEHFWIEHHYGADESAYEFWRDQNRWFGQKRLYGVPIVNRDFDDSTQYAGNTYTKAGWVLKMLREQLGDDDFFRGLHEYLEANRGQNVVTADLQKSIERATSISVDRFFRQWVYGAGAPAFGVDYSYDAAAHQVTLDVTQTQKIEGMVGLFDVPIDVEIATASGARTYSIEATRASQSFNFPADGPPLMVIFDKGDKILGTADFKKDPPMWIYQLKNAETVPDRADAAVALGGLKNNPDALAALGNAATHDPFWGVRVEALRALAKIGGSNAELQILPALADEKPWVREVAARVLANFKDDPSLAPKLASIALDDHAYTVRAAALRSLAEIKAPDAYDILVAAVKSDSPDDVLRDAALGGMGALGEDRAVPILREWSAPGKPLSSRQEAIGAIAALDKKDKTITLDLISYLREPHFDLRISTIFALGQRGDTDAIAPLEDFAKSDEITTDEKRYVDIALRLLKAQPPAK